MSQRAEDEGLVRLVRLSEFYSVLDYFYKNFEKIKGGTYTIYYYPYGNAYDIYKGEVHKHFDDVPESDNDKKTEILALNITDVFKDVCHFRKYYCDRASAKLLSKHNVLNGGNTYKIADNIIEEVEKHG